MYYYDWTYVLLIPALLLSLYAQFRVKSTFRKYSKVASSRGITGAQAAQSIMRDANITAGLAHIQGNLTDHYDPRSNTLRLSDGVYGESSVAALSVAAHEVGHLMQRESGYVPLKIRSALVPVVNFASSLSMPLFIFGLVLGFMQLAWVGIILFSASVLFQLVTLPVEFNASRRAIAALTDGGYITEQERPMAQKVLRAAALTYIAGALSSLLQLLRFVLMARNRRR